MVNNMNSAGKKESRNESALRDETKNSEILFGLDLSKEKEVKDSPMKENLELSESRSIPLNSNLNLNFMNKFPFPEK